jgi:hypothetical protein
MKNLVEQFYKEKRYLQGVSETEAAEQMASEELPTIQQGEDLSVENIPF